jgi:tetratricopeptide (TPR) repeat protein
MDDRFKYLVVTFLEHELPEHERPEFEKYLEDPDCAAYLKKAEFANKLIDDGFKKLVAESNKKDPFNADGENFPEELIADVELYGNTENPEIRQKLRDVHRNMLKRRKRIRLLTYGSAAAVILFALMLLWPPQFNTSSQRIYKSYYKQYEYIAFRSMRVPNPLYNKAIIAYKAKNFVASGSICMQILRTSTREPEIHFLYGLNLMARDSMESAIRQFNILDTLNIPKEESLYVSSHWYKGLCYLSLNKPDSAFIELEKLKELDNAFTKELEVDDLLSKIKK